MTYTATDWSTANLTAANLNKAETQYDEAVTEGKNIRTYNKEIAVEVVASLPATSSEGRFILNTANGSLYVGTGGNWVKIAREVS